MKTNDNMVFEIPPIRIIGSDDTSFMYREALRESFNHDKAILNDVSKNPTKPLKLLCTTTQFVKFLELRIRMGLISYMQELKPTTLTGNPQDRYHVTNGAIDVRGK